jgi:uncharacterized membrane protein (UPF0127 family)
MHRLARIAAGLLFACGLLAEGLAFAASGSTIMLKTETGDHSFDIEVMTTFQERARGLMFRRSLPENSGMLFLYDRPEPAAMWMKNTFIPLDMVFIAPGGTVHRIEKNTEPFSTKTISSDGSIIAVLELNAGAADRIKLKPGDRVIYPGLGAAR